jgi:hypothetical protein
MNKKLDAWVKEMAALCKPDKFIGAMVQKKKIIVC